MFTLEKLILRILKSQKDNFECRFCKQNSLPMYELLPQFSFPQSEVLTVTLWLSFADLSSRALSSSVLGLLPGSTLPPQWGLMMVLCRHSEMTVALSPHGVTDGLFLFFFFTFPHL